MHTEFTFRIILLVLIFAFIAHRGYYTGKNATTDETILKKREEGSSTPMAGILSINGFISVIAYIVNPAWMVWASLHFPPWVRWAGIGIALLGFVLLQWAQKTLGKNWSDTPRFMKEQRLITSGPYQWIRHPIYTAFILILGSTLLISANWFIGFSWLGMTVLETLSRIRFEEAVMLEYFGNEYCDYIKSTGSYVPKLKSKPIDKSS